MNENAPRSRVLVVDDDVGPRESLRALLSAEWEVLCAASVDEAVRQFRATHPDLVIMDIRMSEKSGIDGLREIRKIDPVVSVIMLTGFSTLETAEESLRLGANDYIRKPYNPDSMYEAVRENIKRTLIERRRATAEIELQALKHMLTEQMSQSDHMARLGQKSLEMAHDISTPLTIIMAYVSMLSDRLHSSRKQIGDQFEENIRCLKVIESSVARCHELLDFWRSCKTGSARNRRPISISSLIAEIAQAVKPLADRAGATVKVQASQDQCWVMADSIQIFRSIQNHAVNSIHSLAGPGGLVKISCRADGAHAEVCVEDNGCGIPNDNFDKIFQPYFTTKGEDRGLGLGMFISRNVIEDHGGSIRIESQVRKGTRVIIRLPLCAEDQRPQEMPAPGS